MEPQTAVVSYDVFHNGWLKNNADTFRYVVLQGHGWGYKSDTLQNELKKVIDELKSKEVTFTHFRAYDRMVKGYSTDKTPPSVPAQLKAVREGEVVKLTWKAATDPESGIDCYKIYRDGTCIDLAVVPSYEDPITGKHKYQVRAVNKNDLVSAKSTSASLRK
jgi:DNA-binding transcriptional ArsR family regulator